MENKEKNICMYCGKKSKNRLKYRILNKQDSFRDFCSDKCVVKYYSLTQKSDKIEKEIQKEHGKN